MHGNEQSSQERNDFYVEETYDNWNILHIVQDYKIEGLYFQQFIFFVTYKWVQ